MALTTQERIALSRSLPKQIQHFVDPAIRGSVHDVRQLYHWVECQTSASLELNKALLPIFYSHLNPAAIPDQLLPIKDIQEAVMLAKWSLLGIIQACSNMLVVLTSSLADTMITDALVRHWDTLFPWMQFIYRHFLLGVPHQSEQGYSVPIGEAIKITLRPLHQMATHSDTGNNMICTNSAIHQFVTKLWLYIGALKDSSEGLPFGTGSEGAGHVMVAVVGVITLCVTDPSAKHNLIDAAGGYKPLVASALRYIRWFGRNIPRTRAILGPDHLPMLTTLVIGLSTSIKFVGFFSAADPTFRKELVLCGAPASVVKAMFQTWPTVADMRNDTPTENIAAIKVREMVEHGFFYVSLVLLNTEVPILAVCQILDAGFIELALYAGHRCSPIACDILMTIPRFFMYYKVLKCFQGALNRTEGGADRLQFLAARDEELRRSWSSVHRSARQILDICDKTNARPFYEQMCANAECPCDDNEHLYYQCSGCLIARYCSRYCQRMDWKSRHRTACTLLRSAVGSSGSKHIRRNLPLIMLLETFNYSLYADRVTEAIEKARARYPDEAESLVLESDLSAFPVTFSARPLREYGHMFDSRLQPAMLEKLKGLPGKHILMAIKLKPALESFVVLSPRVALHLAFQWPAARDDQAVLSSVQEHLFTRFATPRNMFAEGDGSKVVDIPPGIARARPFDEYFRKEVMVVGMDNLSPLFD